jgi:hypothetical protein
VSFADGQAAILAAQWAAFGQERPVAELIRKSMKDKQHVVDKRLRVYGASSLLTVVLGVAFAFLSVRISNFQGFFALGAVSLLLIIVGGILGLYCWRLLYVSFRNEVSWESFVYGTFASIVPLIVVYEVVTRQ